MAGQSPPNLISITERLREAGAKDRVSVDEIEAAVGRGNHMALMLVSALLVVTPLSGIPGVSTACGVAIVAISVDLMLRRRRLNLPEGLRRRSIKGAALARVAAAFEAPLRWLHRRTQRRFAVLFRRPLLYLPQAICLLSGLVMPFLEFIPLTSSIVGTGVALVAISLLTRDGLFCLLAMIPYAGLAYVLAIAL